jgi:hypothetical protein
MEDWEKVVVRFLDKIEGLESYHSWWDAAFLIAVATGKGKRKFTLNREEIRTMSEGLQFEGSSALGFAENRLNSPPLMVEDRKGKKKVFPAYTIKESIDGIESAYNIRGSFIMTSQRKITDKDWKYEVKLSPTFVPDAILHDKDLRGADFRGKMNGGLFVMAERFFGTYEKEEAGLNNV